MRFKKAVSKFVRQANKPLLVVFVSCLGLSLLLNGSTYAVWNSTATVNTSNSIRIGGGDNASPPTFVTESLPTALTNNTYSTLIETTGESNNLVISSGSLPPGLSIGSTTGVVSGTPTTPGDFVFTVTATNSGGSISHLFRIAVTIGSYNVSLLAGSGVVGFTNGQGVAAEFSSPEGIAVDKVGNLYVADQKNNMIRKITPQGLVSTLAGNGIAGFADGLAASAEFNQPQGVDVDSVGNVYVADMSNNRIRKISTDGTVTTIAGTGAPGSSDGSLGVSQVSYPQDVQVDASGNVYVADTNNNLIRRISPSNVTTTIAGSTNGYADGTGSQAQFSSPSRLTMDNSGTLYITDFGNRTIRKMTPEGIVSFFAGNKGTSLDGYVNGPADISRFNQPGDIAADYAGNIYVSDFGNNVVRKITPTGTVSTLAGSGTAGGNNGAASTAEFSNPIGVAAGSDGKIYVSEYTSNRIRIIG